ncbi:hypothetical protein [Escherichia phage BEK26]|nr:hypothetical protein [Escherichia phage BEK12A]QGH77518.1 hypothetical protein [Escherichia phage BEK26]
MLKLADIKFPITFESRGIGHYIFTDEKTCHRVDLHSYKRAPSIMEIEHFIDAHNKHYNALKDYGYAMPGYTCLHYKPYKGQVLPVRPMQPLRPQDVASQTTYKRLDEVIKKSVKEATKLTVDKIKYPITFHTVGNSKVTFTSREDGKYESGNATGYKVDYFVDCHNDYNPENEKGIVYYVEDLAKHIFSIPDYWKINKVGDAIHNQVEQSLNDRCKTLRIEKGEVVTIGRIESMPLGAKLLAIQDDEGNYQDVVMPIVKIEVHDDNICLLSHFGGYKSKRFTAELNIKRGTFAKWKFD